ncbi:MAG: hypothetical protein ACYTGL_16315 [Planctomycetota bacterium]|jgi:transposase
MTWVIRAWEIKDVLKKDYLKGFRREVLAACDAGGTTSQVALRLRVSAPWVRRIKQQRREEGRTVPKTTRDRKRMWGDRNLWLVGKIDERPDIYLHEIQAALHSVPGVDASRWTISMACRDVGRTQKKDADCCRAET